MVELLKEVREMKEHLVQYNYHQRMDTVDISKFLPLRSDAALQEFMKPDENWNQRKKARSHVHMKLLLNLKW